MDKAYRFQKMVHDFMNPPPMPRTAPPSRCGILTHDNHGLAAHGAVRGLIPETTDLNWTGELTWTDGGTAIIDGEKPESTDLGLKDNISKDE